jgi:error-prone DNA polymerase
MTRRDWNAAGTGAASGLPAVAAGDVHMHLRARRPLQDTLTAIRLNSTLFAAGHALFANGERHLRSRLRLAGSTRRTCWPKRCASPHAAISRSMNCATNTRRKSFPTVRRRLLPARRGRTAACAGVTPAAYRPSVRRARRTRTCPDRRTAYEAYFLTVYDIVRFARSRNILCQGRGSAANSAVCYASASPKSTRHVRTSFSSASSRRSAASRRISTSISSMSGARRSSSISTPGTAASAPR